MNLMGENLNHSQLDPCWTTHMTHILTDFMTLPQVTFFFCCKYDFSRFYNIFHIAKLWILCSDGMFSLVARKCYRIATLLSDSCWYLVVGARFGEQKNPNLNYFEFSMSWLVKRYCWLSSSYWWSWYFGFCHFNGGCWFLDLSCIPCKYTHWRPCFHYLSKSVEWKSERKWCRGS